MSHKVGVNAGVYVDESWLIKSGLYFINYGEQSSYELTQTNSDTTIVNFNDDRNYYRYFGIPITLGYVFTSGYLEIIPQVSLNVELRSKSAANVKDPSKEDILFINNTNLKKSNISSTAGVDFLYELDNQLKIRAFPFYQSHLFDQLNKSVDFKQRSNFLGLEVGVSVPL